MILRCDLSRNVVMVFVGFLALDGEQPKTIRRLLAIFMKTEAVEHHQYIFQRLLRY